MTKHFLDRLDEMNGRIDDIERNLSVYMKKAGIEETNADMQCQSTSQEWSTCANMKKINNSFINLLNFKQICIIVSIGEERVRKKNASFMNELPKHCLCIKTEFPEYLAIVDEI